MVPFQGLNWTFMLFPFTEKDIERLQTPNDFVEYLIFSVSKRDDGSPVLIGFVKFVSRRRLQFVKEYVGAFASHVKVSKFPLRAIASIRSNGDYFEVGKLPRVGFGGRTLFVRPANVISQVGNHSRHDESCFDVFDRHPRFCIDFARALVQSTIDFSASEAFEPPAYEEFKPSADCSEE